MNPKEGIKQLFKTNKIQNADFKESFEQLSDEEKNYIYYLSKACWAGQPIVLFQSSYESPALFIIFQTFFSSFEDFSEIKSILLKNNVTDINYTNFIRYAANFYSNFGNYTTQLRKKFFPELKLQDFDNILKLSTKYNDIKSIWEIVKYIIYDNTENVMNINLEEKNGKNCFYFGGIKEDQIRKTDEILKKNDISLLNTRLFMLNSSKIVALIGSIEEKQKTLNKENDNDNEIILLYGEYSSFLKRINTYLEEAKKYTSKDQEKKIIDDYINFFTTGEVEKHKEALKDWVKESSSPIDFGFGWNETIFDPMGVRGIFEGFLGIADNFRSQKYEQFVKLIPQLISELPWDENFEDELNSIQFNSMDVICFARNGCPKGKCLPKYYDIREENGVKNFLFFNVCPSFNSKENDLFFLDDSDKDLVYNFGKQGTIILTSIKQLMGFGSGKLFRVENPNTDEEKSNFNRELINPLTEKVIDKYYVNNETFEEKFKSNAVVLNECRALLIGLYFSGNETIQDLFYVNKSDFKNVTYSIWFLVFIQFIFGLNSYDEKNKTWVHPIYKASWILIKYILDTQKEEGKEFIKIDISEIDKETFKIQINKEMILCSAKEILSKLLLKINVWKCTGDVESANEYFNQKSELDETFLKIKKIVDKNETNNTLFLYHNLVRDDEDGSVNYKEYQENLEGVVESNFDRFKTEYNKDVYDQWVKYATNFIKT